MLQTKEAQQSTSIELQFSWISSCPLQRTSSVTWRGTEAKPRGAALARGPGESLPAADRLRQSSGGWGGTPSKVIVLDFQARFTGFHICFVSVTAPRNTRGRLRLLAQSCWEEYVQPKFGPIVPLR